MTTPPARSSRFALFAWGVLAYNLLVVAWGAFVRATGSGAGCGSHWPLCNGEVLPRPERVETLIELSHRLSSAVDGLLVLALAVWAWRAFPPAHPVRRPVRFAALVALAFLISEALIGAGLVRFELVADDASVARALVICAHLVNTFFLLGALALTAYWASGGAPPRLRGQGAVGRALGLGAAGILILGMSGAVTALGDTLFPAESFRQGLAVDFSPGAHFLVRLRVLHPALAVAVGLGLLAAAAAVAGRRPAPAVRRWARRFAALYLTQIAFGLLNLALAAPVWMQLVHLVLADLVWIAWVLLAGSALGAERLASGVGAREPAAAAS